MNGGYTASANSNVIDKFSFSSDGNSTDVGDLTVARYYACGQSSTTHGYCSGGTTGHPANQNIIDKFTFASNADATDAGDLTVARYNSSGQQY